MNSAASDASVAKASLNAPQGHWLLSQGTFSAVAISTELFPAIAQSNSELNRSGRRVGTRTQLAAQPLVEVCDERPPTDRPRRTEINET